MGGVCFKWALRFWVFFIAVFFAACSQEETSPTAPQDRTGEKTEPQSSGDKPESKEPGDKPEYCGDREVIYHHDTVTIYRDTVERVIEKEGASYTSFVYRDTAGAIDTVTKYSSQLSCDVGENDLSCRYTSTDLILIPIDGPLISYDPLEYEIFVIDTVHCHVTITDTVVKDTFYKDSYSFKHDTTFINYGESRATDYIPPERVYEPGNHPFDSTAIRDFFDTLDISDSLLGGKNHLEINSDLRFHGFPLTVRERVQVGVIVQDGKFRNVKIWPEKWGPEEHYYQIERDSTLEADTTVTWTLGFTRYEGGREELDSIQVTTFFKTARASLGD